MKTNTFIIIILFCLNALGMESFAGVLMNRYYYLSATEAPAPLIKLHASRYMVGVAMPGKTNLDSLLESRNLIKKRTIVNLKGLLQLIKGRGAITSYSSLFEKNNRLDSIYKFGEHFNLIYKGYNIDGKIKYYNYGTNSNGEKTVTISYASNTGFNISNSDDEPKISVWILSIGIDDYGESRLGTCKTDAISYGDFFAKQYNYDKSNIHSYLLLNERATKQNILAALKDIAAKAEYDDYFIFNFSGQSGSYSLDSLTTKTCFYPYNVVFKNNKLANRNPKDTLKIYDNVLMLKSLQEYIQQIPATNQLFITEAGPTDNFKVEFIKTLVQNSPETASILNKNRVIIVPNGFGYDGVKCESGYIKKGPINHFITSLDTSNFNIYDLFNANASYSIANEIKNKQIGCSVPQNYVDIFFERQFLEQYREIFGDPVTTRGSTGKNTDELKKASGLTGKRYALIIGTDNYKARDWQKLANPIYDAIEVADELKRSYGFEVKLLKDPPMDSIYNNIRQYYKTLGSDDQLIVYVAGHGDYDEYLLKEGSIVCTDSKPLEDDPVRNSYIQHSKFKRMIGNIPARQILVVLDICFAGTFDEKVLGRNSMTDNHVNANTMQFLAEKRLLKARKALFSSGKNAAFDGTAGKHSPFANLFLSVLRAKGAGTNGIVTLSNIFTVMQNSSTSETAAFRFRPHTSDFDNNDPLSEFILVPDSKSQSTLASNKP